MESNPSEFITVPRSRKLARRRFLGGSDAGIITSVDEAPVMRRPRHEQNIQCLDIITGNPVRTCALVAKSSTAQTPRLRLIGRPDSRSGYRRQQTAENFTTVITAIRMFWRVYAVLWRKLYARFSEYALDQADRVLISRVATDLDILERISMKDGRRSQVPNRQIEHSTRRANLCAPQQARNAKPSNQRGSK
jgi:hypothetical protein